jgi:hypothetical protein
MGVVLSAGNTVYDYRKDVVNNFARIEKRDKRTKIVGGKSP